MTGPLWHRFQEAGERLATEQAAFFPTVVLLLEGLADDRALCALVENAFGVPMPRPPIARTLADLLVCADPMLADVPRLEMHLAPLSPGERRAAERWARATIAAAGDTARMPTLPACVARLFVLARSP